MGTLTPTWTFWLLAVTYKTVSVHGQLVNNQSHLSEFYPGSLDHLHVPSKCMQHHTGPMVHFFTTLHQDLLHEPEYLQPYTRTCYIYLRIYNPTMSPCTIYSVYVLIWVSYPGPINHLHIHTPIWVFTSTGLFTTTKLSHRPYL